MNKRVWKLGENVKEKKGLVLIVRHFIKKYFPRFFIQLLSPTANRFFLFLLFLNLPIIKCRIYTHKCTLFYLFMHRFQHYWTLRREFNEWALMWCVLCSIDDFIFILWFFCVEGRNEWTKPLLLMLKIISLYMFYACFQCCVFLPYMFATVKIETKTMLFFLFCKRNTNVRI